MLFILYVGACSSLHSVRHAGLRRKMRGTYHMCGWCACLVSFHNNHLYLFEWKLSCCHLVYFPAVESDPLLLLESCAHKWQPECVRGWAWGMCEFTSHGFGIHWLWLMISFCLRTKVSNQGMISWLVKAYQETFFLPPAWSYGGPKQ